MSHSLAQFHKLPIGKQIKEIRTRLLMTQIDLATRVGVTQVAVSNLERSTAPHHPRTVAKFAKALKVKVLWGNLMPPWMEEKTK